MRGFLLLVMVLLVGCSESTKAFILVPFIVHTHDRSALESKACPVNDTFVVHVSSSTECAVLQDYTQALRTASTPPPLCGSLDQAFREQQLRHHRRD